MEREKFLKCRDEILEVLENNGADYIEAICLVSSALNTILAQNRLQAHITCADLPDYHGADDRK